MIQVNVLWLGSHERSRLWEAYSMTILSVSAGECDWHFDCSFSLGTVWDFESGSQNCSVTTHVGHLIFKGVIKIIVINNVYDIIQHDISGWWWIIATQQLLHSEQRFQAFRCVFQAAHWSKQSQLVQCQDVLSYQCFWKQGWAFPFLSQTSNGQASVVFPLFH